MLWGMNPKVAKRCSETFALLQSGFTVSFIYREWPFLRALIR